MATKKSLQQPRRGEIQESGEAHCEPHFIDESVEEIADSAVASTTFLINEYELSDFDTEEERLEAEEDLISELNCIRDTLDDCADDGWKGYRSEMDCLSNMMWRLGIAWPQFLPAWSWADVVEPEDVATEISRVDIYDDDFNAILAFSDNFRCTFKAGVHMLVERFLTSDTSCKAPTGAYTQSRKMKNHRTYFFAEDATAIRRMSRKLHQSFKATVHELASQGLHDLIAPL